MPSYTAQYGGYADYQQILQQTQGQTLSPVAIGRAAGTSLTYPGASGAAGSTAMSSGEGNIAKDEKIESRVQSQAQAQAQAQLQVQSQAQAQSQAQVQAQVQAQAQAQPQTYVSAYGSYYQQPQAYQQPSAVYQGYNYGVGYGAPGGAPGAAAGYPYYGAAAYGSTESVLRYTGTVEDGKEMSQQPEALKQDRQQRRPHRRTRNSLDDTPLSPSVGQVQPVGVRPKITTIMWEDEKTLCYQVEANGVAVVRRADNDMINGTKLLNVAKMTRGRRDGILKAEKTRYVVKIGSMHLKGVWIPFERALLMAQREKIVDLLYPLFVKDIKRVIQQGNPTYRSESYYGLQADKDVEKKTEKSLDGVQDQDQGQEQRNSHDQASHEEQNPRDASVHPEQQGLPRSVRSGHPEHDQPASSADANAANANAADANAADATSATADPATANPATASAPHISAPTAPSNPANPPTLPPTTLRTPQQNPQNNLPSIRSVQPPPPSNPSQSIPYSSSQYYPAGNPPSGYYYGPQYYSQPYQVRASSQYESPHDIKH